ncbi:ribonucleotide-diphosphate reductase subunit beta [Rubrobacter radiotolerans]|uniref:Ribonucleotide-diphosphate reductase subunit beta n=1 Tax=Rubrobacter radiotolerans TaxID=42256 RepID=A0AB35TBF5_RUBRA|nr:ribonucleotide-diphosphate reductase subunit beta [Rubrobacter radiotolerans]MDX5895321.1 ribonucleotide-diphosphate reductase subunit beta [Rubrobacter radiotolerans]SMC01637.1 Ribonucleotide reductase, small chain [Rubrobacter radiotolerans DSM 5868]
MTRWSTELLDDVTLQRAEEVPLSEVYRHAEALVGQKPTPRALYERWERQQWSAEEIPLERDRQDWEDKALDQVRETLQLLIHGFVIGEYTALDHFSPLMRSCPDEESLLFLATQAADEARHMQFMSRLANELLGLPRDLRAVLPESWRRLTPANQELNRLEACLVREVDNRPGNYAYWLKLVALFHLVMEGVLALRAQRQLVTSLRLMSIMPGTMAGFIGTTRDESRHVGFGVHALKCGIQEGYRDEICDVVEQAARLLARRDFDTEAGTAQPQVAAANGRALCELLRRRLDQIGLPSDLAEGILVGAGFEPAAERGPAA